jgi:hypothetical protein
MRGGWSAVLGRLASWEVVRFWRSRWPRHDGRRVGEGVVVLGQEMAQAIEKESRHRAATGHVASPLVGIAYEPRSGALDLHRFVESPVDAALCEFGSSYERLGELEAAGVRAALSIDDLYTLLAFVRRSVLASLRGRSSPSLHHALVALTAIDQGRVDWRDVSVGAELLAWAIARAGGDHAAEFRRASGQCERGVADTLSDIASRRASELEPGMWRPVASPTGPVLAEDDYERFEPTVDLIAVAVGVQDVVEVDAYRVLDVTVATRVPPVWLTPTDQAALERALDRVRACLTLHAELDPAAASTARDQHFVVFLAEAANTDDAQLIAGSAIPTEAHEALGLANGRVSCVVVANSTTVGVPAFERAGSLERFAEPLRKVLEHSRAAE